MCWVDICGWIAVYDELVHVTTTTVKKSNFRLLEFHRSVAEITPKKIFYCVEGTECFVSCSILLVFFLLAVALL
jgi:hypothetical protein